MGGERALIGESVAFQETAVEGSLTRQLVVIILINEVMQEKSKQS